MAVPGTEEGNEEGGGTGLKNGVGLGEFGLQKVSALYKPRGRAADLFDRRGGRTWPGCAPHGGMLLVYSGTLPLWKSGLPPSFVPPGLWPRTAWRLASIAAASLRQEAESQRQVSLPTTVCCRLFPLWTRRRHAMST